MSGDDSSWLTYHVAITPYPKIDHNPIEQVGNPIAVATKYIIHPPSQTIHVLFEASGEQSKQEVILEPLIDIANDVVPNVESPRRYELPPRSTRGIPPPRSTRGIPPRRYNPKFEAQ